MNKSVWNIVVVAAVLALGCAHRHRLLVNPEVNIPAGAKQEQVKRAVYNALSHFGWIIEEEKPGATTASMKKEEIFARVRVDYDKTPATVRYLESKNMYYSKSGSEEYIHARYLTWSRNIAARLNYELNGPPQAAPASGSPPRKEPGN